MPGWRPRPGGLFRGLREDLRYAARLLVKSPVFTLAAVASLGLGVGANTTIFSLVNEVLLNPLPIHEPARVVSVFTTDAKNKDRFQSFLDHLVPELQGLPRAERAGPERHGGHAVRAPQPDQRRGAAADLRRDGDGQLLRRPRASAPPSGQTFSFTTAEDEQLGAHPVVVLSDGLWRRRFGASPGIVGSTIELNRQRFTVLGIAPPRFRGINALGGPALWLPMSAHKQLTTGFVAENFDNRRALLMNVVARLRPGVSVKQADSALATIAAGLEKAYKNDNDSRSATVTPVTALNPEFRQDMSLAGAVLMGVVALVLLIACANVANLLLARAAGRRREIAIRIALGASRGRLVRQLLTESLLLGLLAGGRRPHREGQPERALVDAAAVPQSRRPRPGAQRPVLGFALLVSLLTGVLFGLVPALQLSRPHLVEHLKDRTNRGSGYGRLFALRNVLVMAQVALSLVTLVGAGLFLRSLQNAQRTDPGFDTSHLLLLSFDAGAEGYSGEAVGSLPAHGPRARAGRARREGRGPGPDRPLQRRALAHGVPGRRGPERPAQRAADPLNQVGPGYFETVGIPILRGRALAETDRANAPMVAVVNETMARRLWPDQEAIGKRFRCFGQDWIIEVVGVARDAKYVTIGEDPQAFFYLPLAQHPSEAVTLHVRTGGDPGAVLGTVRGQVQSLDARMPITNVITIRQLFDQALWAPRMSARLLAAFGSWPSLLAAIGVHGVVSYSVAERTQEFGIRMAMGARPGGHVAHGDPPDPVTASVGAAFALVVAYAATRGGLGNLLIGVRAGDPVTFGGTLA
jgi:predicted permease